MREYYFDNSATSNPKPQCIIEKVQKAIIELNGNPGRSGYKKAIKIDREIYNTRVKIAEFFNIKNPLQIAFTSNASESLNFAIKGAGFHDCHIITSVLEHNSVLRPLHYLEDEKNVTLSFLEPVDTTEELIKNLSSLLRKDTKAIVINHISNVTGYIYDIEAIGNFCKENNLLFIVDTSQSAGFADINVEKQNINILCFTGHKSLFGIQGTGGIYVEEGLVLNPLLEGGTGSFSKLPRQPKTMPELLECGTLNTPGILSLNAGIDFINSVGLNKIREHEYNLAKLFIDKISNLENIIIYGDKDKFRGPVVSINIEGITSSDFAAILNEEFNICTRSGFHCAPLAHKYLGTYDYGCVRFSFGYFNTEEEILYAADAIKEISEYILKEKF
ncbi:aminotransferase class V-fold PLP-dependent enzyme [Fusobacterium perfoetens]|uniref:aminotransferase class V-fold PLP-dependent enzyme n=1 Tax=Fusobacterium perfoetens TaxID=852 RepID=UPI001F316340|nr:aminotransferase class V-fold PLP-dependent enzyme [Fusobacterium perfoetens]MCF2625300.1 aminotransferase class V-fold PLP-dependent enzyme [Fusobacterium perfoetens]